MNLLLLEPEEVDPSGVARITGRRARHAAEVIGAAAGRHLRVGVVGGAQGEGVVRESAPELLVLEVDLVGPAPVPPPVELILALPRPKALRRLLQTVAALGVGRLWLTNAWRVQKSYFDSPLLEEAALRAELLLGCEQGRTTWVPELAIERLLVPFLEGLPPPRAGEVRILADPGAERPLEAVAPRGPAGRVLLAVGPEGGWIQSERESLGRLGFVRASVSSAVLRSETAVAVLLGQLELLRRLSP